jgi:putative PIN family toxin of toxin-antitoxin system
MLKTVIDTNVIVSALYNTVGSPGKILQLIYLEKIIPVVTLEILREYERVVNYTKFNFLVHDREKVIEIMNKVLIALSPVQIEILGVPDDDLKFVYAALQLNADCLVTGNIKHFAAVSNLIKIMTPAEFIKRYEKTSL